MFLSFYPVRIERNISGMTAGFPLTPIGRLPIQVVMLAPVIRSFRHDGAAQGMIMTGFNMVPFCDFLMLWGFISRFCRSRENKYV
jgi:hypothetical protein